MASPASSSGEGQKKNMEQITFRFCSECSNMLYPKEDPDTHRLQFACRTCQYSEEATSSCVFRNVLNNAVGETAGVTQDVGSDPTVGLPLCLLCGGVVMCEGRVQNAQVDESRNFHARIKLAPSARRRMRCSSSLNRDLRRQE
ncbi:DNA-directed RNA polymerase II subunit RPB9 [Lachnellula cervina]|uniref:DNA-directed RNA polymerase II subunit RPB9 n=1 Tax=Lachnellula cervina TaxID=1316786 RepID=A0A7D8UM68_9HELO|nr:DNA-directed RNA polymerase II subunit RPB9 [Lachnellula cervina]